MLLSVDELGFTLSGNFNNVGEYKNVEAMSKTSVLKQTGERFQEENQKKHKEAPSRGGWWSRALQHEPYTCDGEPEGGGGQAGFIASKQLHFLEKQAR